MSNRGGTYDLFGDDDDEPSFPNIRTQKPAPIAPPAPVLNFNTKNAPSNAIYLCPVCNLYTATTADELQSHASFCNDFEASPSYSSYNQSPYDVKKVGCPLGDGFTGSASEFFNHYTSTHYNNSKQAHACPICTTLYHQTYKINAKTNLLEHLTQAHPELSSDPHPYLVNPPSNPYSAPSKPPNSTPSQPNNSQYENPYQNPQHPIYFNSQNGPFRPQQPVQPQPPQQPLAVPKKNLAQSQDEWEQVDLSALEDVPIKLRLTREYNVTKVTATQAGTECSICMEEFEMKEEIAFLQCLCFYHKHCIKDWYSRSHDIPCPVHRDLKFDD